jgi:hypothetical protein
VKIYDPIKDILITQDGIFNDDGNRVSFTIQSNAKIKVGKIDPIFICESKWYEWALFLKCIRGDSTDNIFSAFPGAFEKGRKDKVGIREAYSDREGKGYNWNNFMLQKWLDHDEKEQRVRERYEFNRMLIDFQYMPEDILLGCMEVIATQLEKKNVPALDVGMGFFKFLGRWNLKRIANNSDAFMPMLRSKYENQ